MSGPGVWVVAPSKLVNHFHVTEPEGHTYHIRVTPPPQYRKETLWDAMDCIEGGPVLMHGSATVVEKLEEYIRATETWTNWPNYVHWPKEMQPE